MSWKVTFDAALVDEVAARLDLRKPNAEALAALIKQIESGEKPEMVADLATGVGKTYIAVGLIEYLAIQGVRNFVIVLPRTAILTKTIANFTPGHRKFVPGSEFSPVIVTSDNYMTASVAADLADPSQVKVFLFNVQTLIKPTDKVARRVRDADEWLGTALYTHLQEQDDLVVIGDEYHVYNDGARSFSAAIRDLSPRAVVGLTATPTDPNDDRIVYRYPLARALADRLVKIPVIVYRTDGIKTDEAQLADACRLREEKETAWLNYASQTNALAFTPCLFVVCKTIAEAERIASMLTAPGLLPDPEQVLLITGGSSDKALEALAAVDIPESPVKAVVAVDMLKEGWDVGRIAVIVAFRTLASESLTEQILGRGLRLPFGKRTGIEAVDTVDIVAHDAWKELLTRKDALLEKVLGVDVGSTSASTSLDQAQGHVIVPSDASEPQQISLTYSRAGDDSDDEQTTSIMLQVREFEEVARETSEQSKSQVRLLAKVPDSPDVIFPRLERDVVPQRFSLTHLHESDVRALGSKFLTDPDVYLFRKAIDAKYDLQDELVVTQQSLGEVKAHVDKTTAGAVRSDLNVRLDSLSMIEQTLAERDAARQVVAWFLEGAGVTGQAEDEALWSVRHSNHARAALEGLIRGAYEDRVSQPTYRFNPIRVPRVPPTQVIPNPLKDRFSPFVPREFSGPWERSIEVAAAFDAKSTEYRIAGVLADSAGIDWWLRIYTSGDLWIEWSNGRYFADFIAIDSAKVHWLIEGKSDDAANSADVVAKREAAENWVKEVNDAGSFGTWRYLFATEQHLWDGRTWADLRKVTGNA